MTETQKSKEWKELDGVKDEHTHVGLGGDNEVEHGECIGTWCEQQDGLLKEQREKIRSLEADRDEVSPVGPNKVERVHGTNGPMQSLGGGGGRYPGTP